jgi:hypothetical protein
MALQLRRGTDAERQGITPKEGELIYVTDTNRLWIGGKIAPNQSLEQGGILVSGSLVNDTNPTLAEDLDLNGNNITGNGNISINGTITATGTVNLGDGVEDNVVVGGQIGSSLIPGTDRSFDLGANASAWKTIYTSNIDVETSITTGDVLLKGNIAKDDSTIIYDGATGSLSVGAITASSLEAAAITGNLTGSVFGDDSTPMVDGVSKVLSNGNVSINGDRIIGSTLGPNYESLFIAADPVVVVGSRADTNTLVIEGSDIPLVLRGEASNTGSTTISVQGSRFTGETKESVQQNDFVGQIAFDGYNGSDFKRAALMHTSVESALNAGNFDTNLTVSVLQSSGLYSQFVFEYDGRFNCVANSYTPLPDAVLPALATYVPAGSVGYGAERDSLVMFDGTSFKTIPTFVSVPSGPSATGIAGQVSADTDYMYICHSTDNWIRVAKDATWT